MTTPEWYKPTKEGISPFDSSYIEEFRLPPERTERELKSLEAIISAMPRKPRVLDIAGGFGRIGSELIKRGLVESLVDLDLNREFLQQAKRSGITKVVQGDMRDLGFQDRSFDLALIMFTSFGYFDDDDNFRVLQEAYRILNIGGVLVLDLPNYDRIALNFTTDRGLSLINGTVIYYKKQIEGQYLIEERFKKGKDGQIIENLLPIKLRVYHSEEIADLCREVGFREVKLFDQELRGFSPDSSQRLWVVSKK
ncbi:MAG: class I SAM-dependent methyltransferase [Microgenomates group bacterium]